MYMYTVCTCHAHTYASVGSDDLEHRGYQCASSNVCNKLHFSDLSLFPSAMYWNIYELNENKNKKHSTALGAWSASHPVTSGDLGACDFRAPKAHFPGDRWSWGLSSISAHLWLQGAGLGGPRGRAGGTSKVLAAVR